MVNSVSFVAVLNETALPFPAVMAMKLLTGPFAIHSSDRKEVPPTEKGLQQDVNRRCRGTSFGFGVAVKPGHPNRAQLWLL